MKDYASNSKSSNVTNPDSPLEKTERPKIEPVVTGKVVQKKPSIGMRFRTVFLGGDSRSAANYIMADVLLPAVRNLIVDSIQKGVERFVYGESSVRPRRPPINYSSRVQYTSPMMPRPQEIRSGRLPDQPPVYPTTQVQSNNLILATRSEAELVLERLGDIVDQYGTASVADLHELCSLPASHIDNKFGWTSLHKSEIRQVREGFLLELPPMEEI